MTVPFEFLALGRPSSVNAASVKKAVWKCNVTQCAETELTNIYHPNAVPAPYASDVTVKVFYFPINRQYVDIDNGLKHTIDAISPPVLKNDRLVQRLVVERFLPVPGASVRAPITFAPTLVKAFDYANGRSVPGWPIHATAVKVECYVANGGTLW